MPVLPLILLALVIPAMLTGLCLVRRRVRALGRWPSVTGRIVAARLAREPNERTPLWKVAVTYRYHVGGNSYNSAKVGIGTVYTDKQQAAEFLAQFPEGHEITVYYNPQNPASSILAPDDPGVGRGLLIGILTLGVIFVLLCAIKLVEIFYG